MKHTVSVHRAPRRGDGLRVLLVLCNDESSHVPDLVREGLQVLSLSLSENLSDRHAPIYLVRIQVLSTLLLRSILWIQTDSAKEHLLGRLGLGIL